MGGRREGVIGWCGRARRRGCPHRGGCLYLQIGLRPRTNAPQVATMEGKSWAADCRRSVAPKLCARRHCGLPGPKAGVRQERRGFHVGYVNRAYHRAGTLWEGRYKSCLVGGERYVLACHRYIELNPVRAAMVAGPADYPWSSHRANTLDIDDARLTTHPVVLGLGVLSEQRRAAYLALFDEVLDAQHVPELRPYLQQQRAFGSDRFQAAIQAQLGRCAQVRPAHRPTRKKGL